jgi:hypothetical protein
MNNGKKVPYMLKVNMINYNLFHVMAPMIFRRLKVLRVLYIQKASLIHKDLFHAIAPFWNNDCKKLKLLRVPYML